MSDLIEQTNESVEVADTQTTQVDSTTNQSTSPRDFTDNDLVRVPGMAEPVRYGDLYKRLQGDYTRKTQTVATQQAALEAREKNAQQQENYLKSLAATLLQKQQQGQTSQKEDNLLSKLEQMQYLDGKTASQLFRELQDKGFGPIVSAIQERDTIIQAMYRKVASLENAINSIQGNHAQSQFDTKLQGWLKQGGYPPEAIDMARETYLAYEQTPELDEEFPAIFQARWNQVQSILRSQDKARVEAAKRQPFKLPGKGGNGVAGKPIGLKGNESASTVAETLWNALQGGDGT